MDLSGEGGLSGLVGEEGVRGGYREGHLVGLMEVPTTQKGTGHVIGWWKENCEELLNLTNLTSRGGETDEEKLHLYL